MSRLSIFAFSILSGLPLLAQESAVNGMPLKVRCLMGLENVKRNAHGMLSLQQDSMQFTAGQTVAKVPVKSIDDIFSGAEMTQSGGAVGAVTKVALPYGGGRALSLLLRTKIDILTLTYRDDNGGFHGVILTLPKGQGEQVRAQLVAGGAQAKVEEGLQPRQEKKQ
ncbi:MAG TPA: hypothetical protein VIX89_07895 [Bryobacteraceae bacterium]